MRRLSARFQSRNLAWARLDPLKTNVHPVSHKRRHCFNGSLSGLVLMRRSMFLLFAQHTLSMRKRAFRSLGLLWAMEVGSLHFLQLMADEAPGVVASAIGAEADMPKQDKAMQADASSMSRVACEMLQMSLVAKSGCGCQGAQQGCECDMGVAMRGTIPPPLQIMPKSHSQGEKEVASALHSSHKGPTNELYSRSLTREPPNPRVGEGRASLHSYNKPSNRLNPTAESMTLAHAPRIVSAQSASAACKSHKPIIDALLACHRKQYLTNMVVAFRPCRSSPAHITSPNRSLSTPQAGRTPHKSKEPWVLSGHCCSRVKLPLTHPSESRR